MSAGYRCAGEFCPGLPYKASDLTHPPSCAVVSTRLRLTADGETLGVVGSERAARRVAREHLGVARVSEWPETDGWCLYPTGDPEDTTRIVRVTVVQS